jgi:hypothetical protein
MWDLGWKSRVASLRMKGRARREFSTGAMARPSGTAREPFWFDELDVVGCWWGRGRGLLVGRSLPGSQRPGGRA